MRLLLPIIQETSGNLINEICLYQQSDHEPKFIFYPKPKLLGIYWKPQVNIDEGKIAFINELFINLKSIQELGKLPEKLSTGLKNEFLATTEASRMKTISILWGQDK
jgi:hypothetical protein